MPLIKIISRLLKFTINFNLVGQEATLVVLFGLWPLDHWDNKQISNLYISFSNSSIIHDEKTKDTFVSMFHDTGLDIRSSLP